MLRGEVEAVDLAQHAHRLLEQCSSEIKELQDKFGFNAISILNGVEPVEIKYPVVQYPEKIISLNFDKTPIVEGTLLGIKGQYLILDVGVINIRRSTGYNIELSYS